jgi:unsaturated rhamnogalacturonyl hydrolase
MYRPRAGVLALILAWTMAVAGVAGCSSATHSPHAVAPGQDPAALSPEAIVLAMTAVADWQLAHMSSYDPIGWLVAPFWAGLVTFVPLSAKPAAYLEAARANGRRNAWQPGPSPFLADDHAITQSYFMLYLIDRDPQLVAPSLARFDEFLRQPFEESLEFDHDTAEREWVWCDALFMAPPALALATKATGDRRYADLMSRRWWKTTGYLYDTREHLFYRDSRFFGEREGNGARVFWSRGNGWVLAGLARVLQYLPEDDPERPRFLALFQDMARRIAMLQRPDGYWAAGLLDAQSWPAPETSGTGLFVYALAWGVNAGALDRARYEPTVRRGWAALVRAIQPDGMLGYAQSPSDRPGATNAKHAEVYASGAFLLAGAEVYRLAARGGG